MATRTRSTKATASTKTTRGASKKGSAPVNPTVMQDVQKALAAGAAPAPANGETQKPTQGEGASATPPEHHIDLKKYVDALSQAAGFSKASIDLEMAVCLAIFAEYGEADLSSKKEVMKAYAGAGWKCETHAAPDYKTVNRRLNAAAALFDKMGGAEAINGIIAGLPDTAVLGALVQHLASNFELTSLNAVWAAAGKPVANPRDWNYTERQRGASTPQQRATQGEGATAGQPLPPEASAGDKRTAEQLAATGQDTATKTLDASNATVLTAGSLTLAIPHGTPYEDVITLITELMAFAGSMKPQEPQATAQPAAKTSARSRKETTH